MFKHGKYWVAGAVVLLLAAAVWWLNRPKPVIVSVTKVDRGLVAATVANTRAGTVKACRRADLAPQTGGQIAVLNVSEGDRVKAGQTLLELWNDDLKAQVELSRNDVVAAGEREEEACVRADVAQKDLKRIARLREKDMTSVDALDRAEGEKSATEAACRGAGAQLKVSEARLAMARATLERTILRAPFPGRVAEINGELGEFVTPSPVGIPTLPTVDLIDDSCLYVSAPIDEVDAPAIRTGMRVRISMDAFPRQFFPGFVRRIAPYVLDVEKQARTVEIEAEIEDTAIEESLLPGYSADVEVIVAEHNAVLRVPTQSVLEGGTVLVLEDGYLVEKPIETGISNWEFTEVKDGLAESERVVVSVDRAGVEPGVRAVAR
jgi:HlyD family secretion protein